MRFWFFFPLMSLPLSAATYYVSTSGSDSADGSQGTPWLTQQHAWDTVQPGDTVLVQPGVYVRASSYDVTKTSGTAESRITFRASGGVTNLNGVSIRHSYITFDGFAFAAITNAAPTWFLDGDGGGVVIAIRTRYSTNAIVTNAIVQNCNIYNMNGPRAVMIWGPNVAAGEAVWGTNQPADCVVSNMYIYGITNNLFFHITANRALLVNNHLERGSAGDCFYVFGESNVIRGNFCNDIGNITGGSYHPDMFQTIGSGNTGGGIANYNIESYGHTFENNVAVNFPGETAIAEMEWYPCTNGAPTVPFGSFLFRNNLFANFGGGASMNVPSCTWVNNTFYKTPGIIMTYYNQTNWHRLNAPLWPGTSTNSVVHNNAFLDDVGYTLVVGTNFLGALNFDGDYNYWADYDAAWEAYPAQTTNLNYNTYGEERGYYWQYSGFKETHGVNTGADPLLIGSHPTTVLGQWQFRHTNSSPMIDVGVSNNIATTDIEGVARPKGTSADCGAFEFDPSLLVHFDFDEGFADTDHVLDVTGNGHNAWQMDSTNWAQAATGVGWASEAWLGYTNGVMTNDPGQTYTKAQYAAITNITGLDFITNGTLLVWVQWATNAERRDKILDCGYAPVFAGDSAIDSWQWAYGSPSTSYDPTCTGPSFKIFAATGDNNSIVGMQYYWTNHLRDGATWHHIGVTWDTSTQQFVAYDAGLPVQTNEFTSPYLRISGSLSPQWLCLGAYQHNGTAAWGDDNYPNTGFFKGEMDEMRIYNRALSSAEIAAVYAGQSGGSVTAQSEPEPTTAPVTLRANTVTVQGTVSTRQ